MRRSSPDEEETNVAGEQVRGLSRERHRDREGLHSTARSSIELTEGVLDLQDGVSSNREASCGVLAPRDDVT
jgi:hypothetical protein